MKKIYNTIGTQGDNMKDMYAKGRRSNKGTNNPNYKNGAWLKGDM